MSRRKAFIFLLLPLVGACQPRQGNVATPATGGGNGTSLAPTTVVARIDGKDVTAAELDTRAKGALVRAEIEHREKVHAVRSEALDELIDDRLVERKAKADGLTSEAFIAREVGELEEPTEEQLRALYQQAREAGQQLPPFENIRDQIAAFVKDQQRKEKLQAFYTKLREEATVVTLLPGPDLPRVDVDTTGPARGPADAPVTIVEFSDYECPFCKRAEDTIKEVIAAYPGKIRLVYREFPLPNHALGQRASEAALCAGDQNKYWEMHDKLFDGESLEAEAVKGYAKELGLDAGKFDGCFDSREKKDAVAASIKAGEAIGVSGTPAFFINGKPISGAVPFERFKEVIDAELGTAAKL